MNYQNATDANMRLSSSIISYGGQPVYIHSVSEDKAMSVVFSYLKDGDDAVAACSDEKWDITPVPIGYVNHRDKAVYLERVPTRRWKQGLHRENVEVVQGDHEDHGVPNEVINTPAMAACILGDYPGLTECFTQVCARRDFSLAFSRLFALSSDKVTGLVWLNYKGDRVGYVHQGSPVLGDRYQYLAEELEGSLS